MPTEDDPSSRGFSQLALPLGGLLILVGIGWLVLLAFGDSASTRRDDRAGVSEPATGSVASAPASNVTADDGSVAGEPQLLLRSLFDGDMETGSTEFSAVALNEEFARLLIADDEGRLFEFDLLASGEPVVPPRRTVQVRVGVGDIEGIVWLAGTRYAIADEAEGLIRVVELHEGGANDRGGECASDRRHGHRWQREPWP